MPPRKTSLDPGTRVSCTATSPPVHDSAVPTVRSAARAASRTSSSTVRSSSANRNGAREARSASASPSPNGGEAPPIPHGKLARECLDLPLQVLVHDDTPAGNLRQHLHSAVVVRRPEPARGDEQVGAQALGERSLELLGPVADDDDALGLEAALRELTCEKGAVLVLPSAARQLAAGDDDRRSGAAQAALGASFTPRAVTTSRRTGPEPRPGTATVLPFSRRRRFAGARTATQSRGAT